MEQKLGIKQVHIMNLKNVTQDLIIGQETHQMKKILIIIFKVYQK